MQGDLTTQPMACRISFGLHHAIHTRCWCFGRSFVPLISIQCCFTQRLCNQHSILQEDSQRLHKLPASSSATFARNISFCATGVIEAFSMCWITHTEHWCLIWHAISLPLRSQCHMSYIRARWSPQALACLHLLYRSHRVDHCSCSHVGSGWYK